MSPSLNLASRRVMVTGGAGFLGRHVVAALERRGVRDVVVPRSAEHDLRTPEGVAAAFEMGPQVVIHLAAVVGGIGANQQNQGRFLYENAMMGLLMLEEARRRGVEKYVIVGTVCSYPKFAPVPFREESLWDGYPEETNAPYGIAKKLLIAQAQAYREQYGMDAIGLIPVNLYGPFDNVDLETSHVIPALIRKCVEARIAGAPAIDVWGSGGASREFIYVEDAAEAIVMATERYSGPEPVNIGTGREVTIRQLAAMIARITGFGGEFRWDRSRPDGQPRRCLDTSRARERFGFVASTSLEEGIARTAQWFESTRKVAAL